MIGYRRQEGREGRCVGLYVEGKMGKRENVFGYRRENGREGGCVEL